MFVETYRTPPLSDYPTSPKHTVAIPNMKLPAKIKTKKKKLSNNHLETVTIVHSVRFNHHFFPKTYNKHYSFSLFRFFFFSLSVFFFSNFSFFSLNSSLFSLNSFRFLGGDLTGDLGFFLLDLSCLGERTSSELEEASSSTSLSFC